MKERQSKFFVKMDTHIICFHQLVRYMKHFFLWYFLHLKSKNFIKIY